MNRRQTSRVNFSVEKQSESRFDMLLSSTLVVMLTSLFLFFSLQFTLANFATLEFPEYGFDLGQMALADYFVLLISSFLGSWAVPKSIVRPSDLFLIIIFIFIIIPFQVMGLSSARADQGNYYALLIVVHLSFLMCCHTIRAIHSKNNSELIPTKVANRWLVPALVLVWAASTVALFMLYGDIMAFSSLDLIYLQRELGKARNFLEGYLQTYYQYVFSPALVAFGCARKNILLLGMGLMGALISYSISAEKAGFIYPVFVIGLFFIMKSNSRTLKKASAMLTGFTIVVFGSAVFWKASIIAEFLVWYIGARSLLIPGTTITVYQDYFSKLDYTYYSHIRGLDLLISVPDAFKNQPNWPAIGLIVGEQQLNIEKLNFNANFIASDGVAAMGLLGCLIAFSLLGMLLAVIDKSAKGIDSPLVIALLLPSTLCLTNGSLFTYLASFGGLFWIFVFSTSFKTAPPIELSPFGHIQRQ